MQISIKRHALVALLTLSVAAMSSGCKSTGWHLPSPGWMSWSKKKPNTSTIAGTRSVPQPPSISVPPYQSDAGQAGATSPYGQTASTGTPGTPSMSGSPYRPAGYGGPQQQVAAQQPGAGAGYYTGPYNTGGSGSTGSRTQQGFYSPTLSRPSGAAAYTADARNAGVAQPNPNTNPYATTASRAGTTAGVRPWPSTGGATTAPTGAYGTQSTPNSATSSYPTGPAATTPSRAYPSSSPSTGYGVPPSTGAMPPAPSNNNLPIPTSTPGAYNATPTGWNAPSPTSSTAARSGSSIAAGTPYLPGSTSRNSSMLPGTASPSGSYATTPTNTSTYGASGAGAPSAYPIPGSAGSVSSATRTASPSSGYPNTYSR